MKRPPLSTSPPEVSVVMGVHNDADQLTETIESVLSQSHRRFEFIIVNDGSTNHATHQILSTYASRDTRIKITEKTNEGLTRALTAACSQATGDYISRIDAGDRYLPERLSHQLEFMQHNPECAVCSCWTKLVTEDGLPLVDVRREDSPEQARNSLRADHVSQLKGITHHGSAMFRRDVYEAVGGYRKEFYFAQDVDLWCRMTDSHGLTFLPEFLYEARFSPDGISGIYRKQQVQLGKLIIQMSKNREAGLPETKLLEPASCIGKRVLTKSARRRAHANALYFVSSLLSHSAPSRGREFLRSAISENPLHLKARIRLLQSILQRTPTR